MISPRFFQAIACGLIMLYFGTTYAGWFSLDLGALQTQAIFQSVFGGVVYLIFRPWILRKQSFTLGTLVAFFFALTAGFAVSESIEVLGYAVPHTIKNPQKILLLWVLSPVIEEWLFRGALWRLFEVVTGSQWPGFLITSVAFSYTHFAVVGGFSPKYLPFMHYQAIYLLALGLFCGGIRIQLGWRSALIAHAAFNVGFCLAML